MLFQHKRPSGNGTPKPPKIKPTAVRFRQSEFISAGFGKNPWFWMVCFACMKKKLLGVYDFKNRQFLIPRVFLAHFVAVSTFGEGIDDKRVPVLNWFWWTRKLKYFLQGGPLTSLISGWKKTSCPFFPQFIGASHVTPFIKFVVRGPLCENPKSTSRGFRMVDL